MIADCNGCGSEGVECKLHELTVAGTEICRWLCPYCEVSYISVGHEDGLRHATVARMLNTLESRIKMETDGSNTEG